jgi:hypothetical protein
MIVSLIAYTVGFVPTQGALITDAITSAAFAALLFVPRSPFAGMVFGDYFRLGFVALLTAATAAIIALSMLGW